MYLILGAFISIPFWVYVGDLVNNNESPTSLIAIPIVMFVVWLTRNKSKLMKLSLYGVLIIVPLLLLAI
jgi:hypothetical protein